MSDDVIEAMVKEYHETFQEGPEGAMRRVLRAALEEAHTLGRVDHMGHGRRFFLQVNEEADLTDVADTWDRLLDAAYGEDT